MTATASRRPTPRLAFYVLLAVFVLLMVWITYTFFTSKFPGAVDFYQRWSASRDFWTQGLNPYSPEVTLHTEIGIFGAPADHSKNQNPGDFVYPMYTALLIAPLALMPFPLAEAIWLVLIGALLVLCFRAMADLFPWRGPAWLMIIGMVWAVIFYPGLRGLLLGQPGTLVACLELLAFWALARDHDVLAGLLLALSLIKPQMGFLLIPFLGLWALRYKRWRFVISFLGITAILLIASFVLLPTWLSDWLRQVAAYPSYTDIGSPVWVVAHMLLPFLGTPGELVMTGLLVIVLLWAWYRTLWQMDSASFDWTLALTLTITMLIMPRTATPPHFVVFLLVIVFYFSLIMRRDPKRGPLWILAIMAITSIGLWWLFLSTLLPYRMEHPINYLPLPFASLIALLLTRQVWLKARPSFDQNRQVTPSTPLGQIVPASLSQTGDAK